MVTMTRFLLPLVMMVLLSAPVWAQGFFSGLPDVPLMPGVVEIEERGLSFDKPEGRILVAAGVMDDSVSDSLVERYYHQALPQFGWVAVAPFQFVRGDEKLEIALQNEGEKNILEITISP